MRFTLTRKSGEKIEGSVNELLEVFSHVILEDKCILDCKIISETMEDLAVLNIYDYLFSLSRRSDHEVL